VEVHHPSRLRQEGLDTEASRKATRTASAGMEAGSDSKRTPNPQLWLRRGFVTPLEVDSESSQ